MFTSACFEPALFGQVPAISAGFRACSAGCAIAAETSGAAASTEGEFDSSDAFSALELPPGHTSVSDRVANLVRDGHAAKAVTILGRELERADERHIGRIIDLSLQASSDMKRFGMAGEAAELDSLLTEWGIDPEPAAPVFAPPPAPGFVRAAPTPVAFC